MPRYMSNSTRYEFEIIKITVTINQQDNKERLLISTNWIKTV